MADMIAGRIGIKLPSRMKPSWCAKAVLIWIHSRLSVIIILGSMV